MPAELYSVSPDAYEPKLRYDMNPDEIEHAITSLLAEHPPGTSSRIVCYHTESSELDNVARTIERRVFERSFGNDAATMASIYGPYEDASGFFLSVDSETRQPVGALRFIDDSMAGSMTFNDLPPDATTTSPEEMMLAHGIGSLDECWDIGTVAVLPEYRTRDNGTAIQLYRAMYVSAKQKEIDHLLAIINKNVYTKMTEYLGIPFVPLAGTRSFAYEGSSENVAVHGYVPDFYPKMSRHSRTLKGLLARKALRPLVYGKNDDAIMFDTKL